MKNIGNTGKQMFLCKRISGLPDGDFSRNNFEVKTLYFTDMDGDTHMLDAKKDKASIRIIHSTLWFDLDEFNHKDV